MSDKKYPLRQIYFYLTKGCNLACRHCWIDPKYQTEDNIYPSLDFELFKSIIEQAKPLGLSGVKLTGGEPLLHPKIYKILELTRVQDLRLTIETNGILCTQELAREIAKYKNPFVSVSIDGVNAETHEWIRGVKGSFEKAKKGMRNLVKAGLKPQVIMTIMRCNKNHMEPLVHMAEELGAGSVKFNIVQPAARGSKMYEEGEALNIEELVNLGEWVENSLSLSTHMPLYYSHPLAFRPLGKMFGDNTNGCGVCGIFGILGVLANGAYALCGIGETIPELVFGDAARERLADIWDNTPILKSLREGLPGLFEGICGECVMKKKCLGSCLAQNYYNTKNLWAPFWYCEEALTKGLFPDTRIRLRQEEVI